jgi:coenzyme F420-reducing hydrogenase delta subunit
MKNVLEQALEVIEAYCSGRLGATSTIAALKEAIANDTLKKQWQREALLEAAAAIEKDADRVGSAWVSGLHADTIRRMAKELE